MPRLGTMAGLPPDQQAVERPSDLAFMFTHYDEALHEAGRAVADAWQLARSGSTAGLAKLAGLLQMPGNWQGAAALQVWLWEPGECWHLLSHLRPGHRSLPG